MTDCIEIQSQIMDYIDGTLSDEDMETFLSHVNECSACKDELNIYYTVYLGLRQLENNDVEIEELKDVDSALEEQLEHSAIIMKHKKVLQICAYVFATVLFWSITSILIFEFKIFNILGYFL